MPSAFGVDYPWSGFHEHGPQGTIMEPGRSGRVFLNIDAARVGMGIIPLSEVVRRDYADGQAVQAGGPSRSKGDTRLRVDGRQ